MRRFKRVASLAATSVVAFSSLLSVGIMPTAHAAGATVTWTGNECLNTSDMNMTTATNWSGNVAPVAGDNLVFPDNPTCRTPVNDFPAGTSFGSISFTHPQPGTYDGTTLTGNALAITGGITDTTTGGVIEAPLFNIIDTPITFTGVQTITETDQYSAVALTSQVTGSSNLTFNGAGALYLVADNSTYTGQLTANGGTVLVGDTNSVGTSSGLGAVINDGADFDLFGCTAFDFAGNLTLTGNSSLIVGDQPNPKLGSAISSCGGTAPTPGAEVYGGPADTSTVHMTGSITLGSDITFAGTTGQTVIAGPLAGAHTITMLPGNTGKLVVASSNNTSNLPNGTYGSALFTKTLSDSQASTELDVYGNNTVTLDGQRGNTTLYTGAVLKGSGTTRDLIVNTGATVAPGHSPGCLNSGNLTLNGTYQVEIGGTDPCTGYDQIKVTGTVDVTNGNLDAVRYNDFKDFKQGQKFTIIDNDGSDAITGTLANLPEGATFKLDNGTVLGISYKGGDGNDVVLAVQSVPATPDTGFGLVAAHPLTTLAGTVLASGMLVGLAQANRKGAFRR